MHTFTVKLFQYAEEVCEIEVQADTKEEAWAIVHDSICRNMLDEEHDLYWSDGSGIHPVGVQITEVSP